MRRRVVTVVVWVLVLTTVGTGDDEGAAADEALITGALITGAAAFVWFVVFKVVPYLRSLDLPVISG